MTYEEHISALVDRIPSDGYVPLFAALGCRYLARTPARQDVLMEPGQPAAIYEALIAQTLIHVMQHQLQHKSEITSETVLTLLDGLLRKDRWRVCLQSSDAATDFAILVSYLWNSAMQSTAGIELINIVVPRVCEIVNEWVEPTSPFKAYDAGRPVSYDFAAAVFGQAWCSVALDGAVDGPWSFASITHNQRPPVLPNLLPSSLRVEAVPLPALDTP